MKKQFAIIGLGKFGAALGVELVSMGNEVLGVDISEEKVDALSDAFTHVIQADCTEEANLHSLGLRNFDVVIVAVGEIQSSIMITLFAKDAGAPYVIAKAKSDIHTKLLYKVGADKVVFPERDMGTRMAHSLASSNILEFIELSQDYSLLEFEIDDEWVGKSIRQIDLRRRMNINIIGIKRQDGTMIITLDIDAPLEKGDILVLIGKTSDMNRLEKGHR